MKATLIQSDSRLVITTNRDVATVTKDFMLTLEKQITVQESEVISDFEIVSSKMLNPVGKMVFCEVNIGIGSGMVLEFEVGVIYSYGRINIGSSHSKFEGKTIILPTSIYNILGPIIRDEIRDRFNPQICAFYEQ